MNRKGNEPGDPSCLDQVRQYRELREKYVELARCFAAILQTIGAETGMPIIVQARAKEVASFAEKIRRPNKHYTDPINQITDLCGARVIAPTLSGVATAGRFIEKNFSVVWGESEDKLDILAANEFGYLSQHYVVSFKPGVFSEDVVPPHLFELKAEIQVRTILEHAWSEVSHELQYKGLFVLPRKWDRELSRLAAVLEEADGALDQLLRDVEEFGAGYDAYLTPEQKQAEVARLEVAIKNGDASPALRHKLARLAMSLEEWSKAAGFLEPLVGESYAPALRDYGVVVHMRHRGDPEGEKFRRGQDALARATELNPTDADAWASLAGTWRTRQLAADDESKRAVYRGKARALYRRAYEADPGAPYALGNFIEYELAAYGELRTNSGDAVGSPEQDILSHFRPSLNAAIERCRAQAEVRINLPWAYFDLGKFRFLLGDSHAALEAYAKAVQCCSSASQIESTLRSFEVLKALSGTMPGFEALKGFLSLAEHVVFGGRQQPGPKKREKLPEAAGGIVIVTGYCDTPATPEHRALIVDAFKGIERVVISGGTKAGIPAVVGELQRLYPGTQTVGYLPASIVGDVALDDRYGEIRHSEGDGFSPLEPLSYWSDLAASRIAPDRVKLLAIGGNKISAAECSMALAFGAQVGIVKSAGGMPAALLDDELWRATSRLRSLEEDAVEIREFLEA